MTHGDARIRKLSHTHTREKVSGKRVTTRHPSLLLDKSTGKDGYPPPKTRWHARQPDCATIAAPCRTSRGRGRRSRRHAAVLCARLEAALGPRSGSRRQLSSAIGAAGHARRLGGVPSLRPRGGDSALGRPRVARPVEPPGRSAVDVFTAGVWISRVGSLHARRPATPHVQLGPAARRAALRLSARGGVVRSVGLELAVEQPGQLHA
jgi:hypothetical protein